MMTKDMNDLLRRVEKLELAVFGAGKAVKVKRSFKGATGGLRLLANDGFFDRGRFFSEIESELRKRGYYYSKQAIQTPLNRMSGLRGPLVSIREKGRKLYAKRR